MRLTLLALLVLAVLPATAAAAEVRYTPPYVEPADVEPEESCSRYSACPPSMLEVQSAAGEANRLTLTLEGGFVVVRDAGAPLTGGSGCTAADGAVRCPVAEFMRVAAGDGDDEVAIGTGLRVSVTGGDGNDALSGAWNQHGDEGDDVLTGTPSHDTLVGGRGSDRVVAGDGNDFVADGDEVAPDLLDGGTGIDTLTFDERPASVVADLGSQEQSAGSGGEDNLVTGFELVGGGRGDDTLTMRTGAAGDGIVRWLDAGRGNDVVVTDLPVDFRPNSGDDTVTAGPGPDRLSGGAGRDRLTGGAGDDILEDAYDDEPDRLDGGDGADVLTTGSRADILLGGAGADTLTGGAGRDRIDAGAGNDRVHARDRRRDRIACGTGRDRAFADRLDHRRGCEDLRLPRR